ncbi:type VI secretion system baseplate subunit TssE [Paraburkholderia phytofirmans]|jgi:type VI secretion system protein ImpF|uniref:type VI secretion system baseplate subunit TssE n=1 Tax=Paraburkholderia sp. BL9I2N2 TaxID=1938809 RepID=UPI00104766EF|nr:type VI secretion system baseplate subunit TssE [Paraburkholderia sp. BL9I2N2]TCK95187.1 type VI secretion system protein ImpF [Paraburkholderia sp. BL9I2N2]
MRLKNAERVQPSLLERLTDHEPDATREVREHRSSSARSLRRNVMRDLGWLLNAQGIASSQDVARYPGVAESVLNFGFSDLAGKSASNVDVARIERLMADAIRAFEPRILPGTLRVRAIQRGETSGQHNAIAFIVEGDLHAHPVPERLYLRTELDLEAGKVDVSEGPRA